MNKAAKERLDAAYKLLCEDLTTIEKFESIRALIKDINSKIDTRLEACSQGLSKIQKLQKGEIIELTVENLQENTEEEKQRKKALLFLLRNWNNLKSEVKRVSMEFENAKDQGHLETSTKIMKYAKGPFGLITLAAVLIVGFITFLPKKSSEVKERVLPTAVVSNKPTIKVLEFRGKKIPFTEVAQRNGPDCDSPHYHALNHISVRALDGTIVNDPGSCGFGRVKETKIVDAE